MKPLPRHCLRVCDTQQQFLRSREHLHNNSYLWLQLAARWLMRHLQLLRRGVVWVGVGTASLAVCHLIPLDMVVVVVG